MFSWASIVSSALSLFNKLTSLWAKKDDQATGAKLDQAANSAQALQDASDVNKADATADADGVDAIRQRLSDSATR